MFEQMLLPSGGTRQARDAALAFAVQTALVAFAVLVVPGLYVLPLPKPEFLTTLIAPPLPPAPPPPPTPAAATRVPVATVKPVPRVFNYQPLRAPVTIPQQTPEIADAPSLNNLASAGGVVGGVPGGVPGGIPGGTIGGTLGGTIGAPPALPQPVKPPAPKATPARIRVGGEVEAAKLTHEVTPRYPAIARDARIAGVVELSATIAADGTVKDLKIMSGNPLLTQAAVDAVKQWTYRPTYLNGKPVEVLTEVDVKFTLG